METLMQNLMRKIVLTFDLYGDDLGLDVNATMITVWRDCGIITMEQYKELRKYNRTVYSNLPI